MRWSHSKTCLIVELNNQIIKTLAYDFLILNRITMKYYRNIPSLFLVCLYIYNIFLYYPQNLNDKNIFLNFFAMYNCDILRGGD